MGCYIERCKISTTISKRYTVEWTNLLDLFFSDDKIWYNFPSCIRLWSPLDEWPFTWDLPRRFEKKDAISPDCARNSSVTCHWPAGKKKDAVEDLRLFRLDAHVHNHHRLVAAAAAVLIGYIAYESRPRETAADCNVLLHTLCVRISLPTTPASGRPAKSRVISKASRSFSLHHRLRRTSTAHNISNPLRLVPPEKCIDPFSARRAYLIRDE